MVVLLCERWCGTWCDSGFVGGINGGSGLEFVVGGPCRTGDTQEDMWFRGFMCGWILGGGGRCALSCPLVNSPEQFGRVGGDSR